MLRKRFIPRAISGVLVALVTLACGTPSAPAPAKDASTAAGAKSPTTAAELLVYQGADRQQILETNAKSEGKVVWYTSLAGNLLKDVTEGFEKKYPGIKLEIFRAESPELATRVLEEAQSKKPNADVLEVPAASLSIIREAKLVTPYYTPESQRYPADVRENAT